jgi:hypothetical protein
VLVFFVVGRRRKTRSAKYLLRVANALEFIEFRNTLIISVQCRVGVSLFKPLPTNRSIPYLDRDPPALDDRRVRVLGGFCRWKASHVVKFIGRIYATLVCRRCDGIAVSRTSSSTPRWAPPISISTSTSSTWIPVPDLTTTMRGQRTSTLFSKGQCGRSSRGRSTSSKRMTSSSFLRA